MPRLKSKAHHSEGRTRFPLIEHFVTRWNRGHPVESRRSIFKHFETSCDELGSFELVAGDVTIEQLAS
jgi:hypothetical protein